MMNKYAWTWGSLAIALGSCNDGGSSVWHSGTEGGGQEAGEASAEDGASGQGPGSSGAADSTGAGATDSGTSASESSTGEFIFDVGNGETEGLGACGCDLSYIWIANSDEGTVSKIDTGTLMELGRYRTRADGQGNPSRTSVSLSGDVAVANRHGGLVKFYAQEADCIDSNGVAGIQTSSGAADVLAWEMEECRAWYTEFPVTNQRPVAWTQGSATDDSCDSVGEKIWTVASAVPGLAPGTGGFGGVNAYLVDGETGAIEEEILIEEFSGFQLGAYGGAVDGEGDLWFSPMGGIDPGNPLVRVDVEDFTVETFAFPGGVGAYGITVDHSGRVWVSSVLGSGGARFDPTTGMWDVLGGSLGALGGLAEDGHNHMWIATEAGAVSYDVDTLAPGNVFIAPGGGGVKGISVDADGFVWAVNDVAWKIDPETGLDVGSYNGLSGPYTYSDMTGWALANTTCPPEG